MKSNKTFTKELNKEFIKQVESKSNYQANIEHLAPQYRGIKIYKMNYQNKVWYSFNAHAWYDNRESVKKAIAQTF